MAYFDGIKVGDRVYSFICGWTIVTEVDLNRTYSITTALKSGLSVNYTLDGRYYHGDDVPQSLFWDEPQFTPPPRPKRLVKKQLEGWVNVYKRGNEVYYSSIYDTEADAHDAADTDLIACVKLTGEYEVEE
jgi:hypothetical protein